MYTYILIYIYIYIHMYTRNAAYDQTSPTGPRASCPFLARQNPSRRA